MKLILKTLALSVFLLSCSGDEEEQTFSGNLFTLNVEADYETSNTDNWIFVHDESGEVLDYKPFEAGDQLVMSTNEQINGSRLAISLVTYYGEGDKLNYEVNTSVNYAIGDEINLTFIEGEPNPSPAILGSFFAEVSLNFKVDHHFISNRFSESCAGSAINSSDFSVLRFNCNLREGASKHLLQVSGANGFHKYKWLNGITPNATFSLTQQDLANFDRYATFQFPISSSVYLYVQGREPGHSFFSNGYDLQRHYNSDPHSSITTGYLNSLTNYTTSFSASYTWGFLRYENRGGIPETTVSWPSITDFSVSSKSIQNYSFSTSASYVEYISSWHYKDPVKPLTRVRWQVFGNSSSHRLMDFPLEFLNDHPLLKHSDLTYAGTTLHLEGPTYKEIGKLYAEGKPYVSKIISFYQP